MKHPDERQMCRDHGELLEAIGRAEAYADGPELLNPWSELGAAWQAFEAEQKGGAGVSINATRGRAGRWPRLVNRFCHPERTERRQLRP